MSASLNAGRAERAQIVYRVSLYYTVVLTAAWLLLGITGIGGGAFFPAQISLQPLVATVSSIVMFWAIWSYGWYFLKRWQLRRAGFSPEELAAVFGNRLKGFDLDALLARHPTRRIRVIDMIARRGRTALLVGAGFTYVYLETLRSPGPEGLSVGIQANVLDSIVMNWLGLIAFRSNGVLGHMMYGACRAAPTRSASAPCGAPSDS